MAVVRMVERLWRLDGTDAQPIVDGATATIRLPEAGVAVHVSRVLPSSARVEALHTARRRLGENGLPVVRLLPSVGGRLWEPWRGRFVEVERWVDHNGRMNTWDRLLQGAPVLAAIHDAWAPLHLGPDADHCPWANWISAAEVGANASAAGSRLSGWGLVDLADDVRRLARLTSTDVRLPDQVVHGDFWDDNVYLRDEEIVAVTDFDLVGRRPRIDDLALMLYFADEQPFFDGSGPRTIDMRIGDLAPLVWSYNQTLSRPLTEAELGELPFALARQPLWTYAKRVLEHPDPARARHDAVDTAPAVTRAPVVMEDPGPWSDAFAGRF